MKYKKKFCPAMSKIDAKKIATLAIVSKLRQDPCKDRFVKNESHTVEDADCSFRQVMYFHRG